MACKLTELAVIARNNIGAKAVLELVNTKTNLRGEQQRHQEGP